MAIIKWKSVCSKCGRAGRSTTRSESIGEPQFAPRPIEGKCPSSVDGKHKPIWKEDKKR